MARKRTPPPAEGPRRRTEDGEATPQGLSVDQGVMEASVDSQDHCKHFEQEAVKEQLEPLKAFQWRNSSSYAGEGDFAGGPVRNISLSNSGRIPALCCLFPGFIMFGGLVVIFLCAVFSPTNALASVVLVLTYITLSFSTNLAVSCAIGALKMRRDASKDWDALLQGLVKEHPEYADASHVVILPNYKEDEQMLLQTLENIAVSPMARSRIRVVLAMEEREGPQGKAKAERLIAKMSHCFADIFASHHPANLPGDVAGKSSNAQWGYNQMLRRYASFLSKNDMSRVFVTVGDADTLWHPQFWSALAYQALKLPVEERVWSMFQPPIMLTRNLFSVPSATRISGYATILFELAGLTNQYFGSAFTYSSYSLTLALASHPLVGGWDRDVIAEDHHMFAKCYFASLWEQAGESGSSKGKEGKEATVLRHKLHVRGVYLPAVSYLVESSDGWWASMKARFDQARRHAQGISELSYFMLQYITLLRTPGAWRISFATHRSIILIMLKMITVHLLNQLQAVAVNVAAAFIIPSIARWVLSGGPSVVVAQVMSGAPIDISLLSFGEFARQSVFNIFGPIPPVAMLMSITTFLVVRDFIAGRLGTHGLPAGYGGEGKHAGEARELSSWETVKLFLHVQFDFNCQAYVTMVFFGLIPAVLASWSIMRHGTRFEYIVGAKPTVA